MTPARRHRTPIERIALSRRLRRKLRRLAQGLLTKDGETSDMIITAQQAGERLGISTDVIKRLVRDNHLKPVNQKADGAKKFFMKFDSSHISEFKNSDTWKGMAPKARVSRTARRAVETLVTSRTATAASVRVGLRAQLDRLEAKIDRLLEAVEA